MNLLQAIALEQVQVDADALQAYGDWSVVVYEDQNKYVKVQIRNPEGKYLALSRLILGTAAGVEVDHENLNPLDCRRNNLREATSAQNKMNRDVRKDSQTGYKGVYLVKATGLYRAMITTSMRRLLLGSSYDPVVAAKMYDTAAKKYFGEFARLNFPEESVQCENSNAKITNGWNGGDSSVSCQMLQS